MFNFRMFQMFGHELWSSGTFLFLGGSTIFQECVGQVKVQLFCTVLFPSTFMVWVRKITLWFAIILTCTCRWQARQNKTFSFCVPITLKLLNHSNCSLFRGNGGCSFRWVSMGFHKTCRLNCQRRVSRMNCHWNWTWWISCNRRCNCRRSWQWNMRQNCTSWRWRCNQSWSGSSTHRSSIWC